MNKNNAVTISGSGKISAVINGNAYSIANDHPNYTKIIDSIRSQNWDSVVSLVDISSNIKDYTNGNINIVSGVVHYNNEALHNALTTRIVDFMGKELPFEPLIKFLHNLMENPSKRAVDELYGFLEEGELPITEDGCFLAFKNVRSDYKDIHSGTFDNSIGKVCEMPRNRVCDNRDLTCSNGLHFCSIEYLPNFIDSDGGKTMILKINPKDVVSIPSDYNNTKGRTCRYEVVGEYKDDWREKIGRGESGWDSPLYSSDGGDYEDEDDDEVYDDPYTDSFYNDPCEDSTWGDDSQEQEKEYGTKPCGQKFYNVRGEGGRFTSIVKKAIDIFKKKQ